MKAQKLKNGMRYHLIPFEGTDAVTVLVLTKVGSRYEPLPLWGGSHFIEHLMFKGTERRPNTIDISRTLDRYGAQYNAYTGKDLTGYYVKIDRDKTEIAVDLLHDMLFHSKFEQAEMDKERRVIIEEIKMYEENPIMHLEDLLEDALFNGTTLGRNIAGTAEGILAMNRENLINFRDKYYAPSEMVIAIAGNVPDNAEELLENTFGSVQEKEKPSGFDTFGEYKEREEITVNTQVKPLEQIQLGFAFPSLGRGHKDISAVQLMSYILGGAMSSRLFIEVREKRGLCYAIGAGIEAYNDIGVLNIRSGLDAKRTKEAAKTILEEVDKMKSTGVTAEELQEAKEHMEGAMKLSLENSSVRATFYAQQELFLDRVKMPEERISEYQKVTLEDVQRLSNEIFNLKKMSIAGIGPFSKEELLKEVI